MQMKTMMIAAFATAASFATASAQELTGTLKKVKETGTITIGYRDASVPFSYLDDKQQPIGFAMDICAAIVEGVKAELKMPGLKVALVPVTSATRIPLLANGTVDLECGSTTNNADRQKQISYTNTHFITASRYVTKKADKITKIDDLKGKTVVSTAGTTNIRQVNEANTARGLNMTILPAKDHAEAFLMVETDRAAAFVMDDILLASLVANARTPGDYTISTDAFSLPEPYGIMLRKDDPAFKKIADDATAKLYGSPAMAALYNKWFNAAIPPRGINLNSPMNEATKKMFAKPTDSADPAAY
jgi:glutamate/aspartate transport system substrate-binding protein